MKVTQRAASWDDLEWLDPFYESVIRSAELARKPVRLRVLKGNPAKELYLRLGFEEIEIFYDCSIMERRTN
jgi:hypothetical protein